MIPLKFIHKPEKEKEDCIKLYIDKLLEHTDKNKIDKLDSWCKNHLEYNSNPCSFKTIIQMPYEGILNVVDELDLLLKKELFPPEMQTYMNTLYETHVPRKDLVDILGETVCPYCNRMYINRSNKHTICQFDHFFDKSTYPILAVSFYNLIPCCGTCNLIKKNQMLDYSPYDENFTSADQLIKFDFEALDYTEMSGDKPPHKILVNYLNPKMETNGKKLELEEVYQIHTDEIQELILKQRMYGERYVDHLNKKYSQIGISLGRLVVGSYISPDGYGKRPLSKMKTDIAKKLNII